MLFLKLSELDSLHWQKIGHGGVFHCVGISYGIVLVQEFSDGFCPL